MNASLALPLAEIEKICSRRILVVSLRSDGAQMLKRLLELKGHEAKCAYDGAEGAATAIAWQAEIVLSSVELPGLDGFELAQEIRGKLGSDPLLIATTSYSKRDVGKQLKQAGFDLYLAKPISKDALFDAISVRDGHAPTEESAL